MSTSVDDLSDSPPQSYLPSSSSRSADRNHDPYSHESRPLLAPPTDHPHRSEHRPSSRRALTRALELAREAVQLDSTNDNPLAAVNAYAQSVALLSGVMERVRNGEDSTTDSHRRRRRRSVAAQEEEVRRLQNIVSTTSIRILARLTNCLP
jgi:CHASE3 domain sensor protein